MPSQSKQGACPDAEVRVTARPCDTPAPRCRSSLKFEAFRVRESRVFDWRKLTCDRKPQHAARRLRLDPLRSEPEAHDAVGKRTLERAALHVGERLLQG
jgi:hypothetical protein